MSVDLRTACVRTWMTSPLPVLIYNIPAVTSYDMPVETIAELSHHPNILGMKDSSGNVEKLAATHAAVEPGFQILSGSGMTFGGALSAGASGASERRAATPRRRGRP